MLSRMLGDHVSVAAQGAPHGGKDVRDVFGCASLNCNRRGTRIPVTSVIVRGDICGFVTIKQNKDLVDIRPFTTSRIDVVQVFGVVLADSGPTFNNIRIVD